MKRPSAILVTAAAVLVLAACETGPGPDADAPALERSALSSLAVSAPASTATPVTPGAQDSSSTANATGDDPATDSTTTDATTGDPSHAATCLDFSSGSFLLVPCLALPMKKGAATKAHGDPEPWRPGTPIPQSW